MYSIYHVDESYNEAPVDLKQASDRLVFLATPNTLESAKTAASLMSELFGGAEACRIIVVPPPVSSIVYKALGVDSSGYPPRISLAGKSLPIKLMRWGWTGTITEHVFASQPRRVYALSKTQPPSYRMKPSPTQNDTSYFASPITTEGGEKIQGWFYKEDMCEVEYREAGSGTCVSTLSKDAIQMRIFAYTRRQHVKFIIAVNLPEYGWTSMCAVDIRQLPLTAPLVSPQLRAFLYSLVPSVCSVGRTCTDILYQRGVICDLGDNPAPILPHNLGAADLCSYAEWFVTQADTYENRWVRDMNGRRTSDSDSDSDDTHYTCELVPVGSRCAPAITGVWSVARALSGAPIPFTPLPDITRTEPIKVPLGALLGEGADDFITPALVSMMEHNELDFGEYSVYCGVPLESGSCQRISKFANEYLADAYKYNSAGANGFFYQLILHTARSRLLSSGPNWLEQLNEYMKPIMPVIAECFPHLTDVVFGVLRLLSVKDGASEPVVPSYYLLGENEFYENKELTDTIVVFNSDSAHITYSPPATRPIMGLHNAVRADEKFASGRRDFVALRYDESSAPTLYDASLHRAHNMYYAPSFYLRVVSGVTRDFYWAPFRIYVDDASRTSSVNSVVNALYRDAPLCDATTCLMFHQAYFPVSRVRKRIVYKAEPIPTAADNLSFVEVRAPTGATGRPRSDREDLGGSVFNYHSTERKDMFVPVVPKGRKAAPEEHTSAFYQGFEMEMMFAAPTDAQAIAIRHTFHVAPPADVHISKRYVTIERDGSLCSSGVIDYKAGVEYNGFEVVSGYTTPRNHHKILRWAVDNPDASGILEWVSKIKESTCAGTHVHNSLSATTTNGLAKLLYFMHSPKSAAFLKDIAGRYNTPYCRVLPSVANKSTLRWLVGLYESGRRQFAEQNGRKMSKVTGQAHSDMLRDFLTMLRPHTNTGCRVVDTRHNIVRLSPHTIEFRMFKGATDLTYVLLAMEFCHSILTWVEGVSWDDLCVESYLRFIFKDFAPQTKHLRDLCTSFGYVCEFADARHDKITSKVAVTREWTKVPSYINGVFRTPVPRMKRPANLKVSPAVEAALSKKGQQRNQVKAEAGDAE